MDYIKKLRKIKTTGKGGRTFKKIKYEDGSIEYEMKFRRYDPETGLPQNDDVISVDMAHIDQRIAALTSELEELNLLKAELLGLPVIVPGAATPVV